MPCIQTPVLLKKKKKEKDILLLSKDNGHMNHWKNVPIDLFHSGLPQAFNLLKKKIYLQSAIK
jgi:hypothetical protein